MNKIVREHYPVSKLPQDLREGLDDDAKVTVIVEEQDIHQDRLKMPDRRPLTALEAVEAARKFRQQRGGLRDPDEPVARIRQLRDEWDDE